MNKILPYKSRKERKAIYEKLLAEVDETIYVECWYGHSFRKPFICWKLINEVYGYIKPNKGNEIFELFPEFHIAFKKYVKENHLELEHSKRSKALELAIFLTNTK